ncbi:ABC-2 family transporter protein [Jatrophihabitans endophyticus]|uniref:ABC-2 family transporter protein n=1 Tax=Jatrophihabitans endophyticus TaxID=1206085 RepID=A0A1M5E776_9ACTN|nr:ABC transporter permease [Jatrophihabitans endophyticus]SHF75077.1 ABC-2 family transporter protein [Jatrophihabitans endophyticus]
MIRLIRAELLKLRTTQVWFWLLLATVAVSVLLVVAQIAPSDGVRDASQVPDLFSSAANGYVVVFVLGVLGITTEFRYQTITPTVLITPSRWAVVTAKMITYALVGIVYALAATLAELVVAVPWLAAEDVDVDFGNGDVQHAVVGVFAVLALFGIVGLGIGALLRNQIVAVVVGIVYLIVLQPIISAVPGLKQIFPYTPGGAVISILHTGGGDATIGNLTLLPTAGGVVALLLWAFVPAVLGAQFTLTRDIT